MTQKSLNHSDDINIKIFAAHKNKTPVFANEYFIPIQMGREVATTHFENMLGDNTGQHISDQVKDWGSLTVLYWIWKNVDAEYYGICDADEYFSFKPIKEGDETVFNDFSADTIKRFAWDPADIKDCCAKHDILARQSETVSHEGINSNGLRKNAWFARFYNEKNLAVIIDIVKRDHPHIFPFVLKAMASTQVVTKHQLIMHKKYFMPYCEWLFDVLFKAQKHIDTSQYGVYQNSVFAEIACILADAYINYLEETRDQLKVIELTMVKGVFEQNVFDLSLIAQNIKKQCQENLSYCSNDEIAIVFNVNVSNIYQVVIAMHSIMDNTNRAQKVAFYLLHESEDIEHNQYFAAFNQDQVSLHWVAIKSTDYWTNPLIARSKLLFCLLPEVLPASLDKVLYLNAEVLFTDNVALLWDFPLNDKCLAGALHQSDVTQAKRLLLSNDVFYINTNVLLLNLEKLRGIDVNTLYLESFFHHWEFVMNKSNDILNIAFQHQIAYLPMRWNVQEKFYLPNEQEYSYSRNELEEAALNPAVLQYESRSDWVDNKEKNPLLEFYNVYLHKYL